jgi:hypothetical protein
MKNKFNQYKQFGRYEGEIPEYSDFTREMELSFVKHLKESPFFKELISILKTTKIERIDYSMGVFFLKLKGVEKTLSSTDLEDSWIALEDDEEPTERLYQSELDAWNFLETIWVNESMLDRTFFYEFKLCLNQALS